LEKALKPAKPSTRKSSVRKPKAVALRVALAQINTTVGDFKGNAAKIKSSLQQARKAQADLVLFPELTLTGYPPEDLLLKKDFIQRNLETLNKVASVTKGLTAVIGYAEPAKSALFNSAALISDGKILGSCRKMLLPNYGVFDEKRYFQEGTHPFLFTYKGLKLGLTVCEDIWEIDGPGERLSVEGQVDAILNISSSPYYKGKGLAREEMIRERAREYQAIMIYANLVGGQDELVFDGQSLIVAPDGLLIAKGREFAEEMIVVDLAIIPKRREKSSPAKGKASIKTCRVALPSGQVGGKPTLPVRTIEPLGEMQEVFGALVLGTRDYVRKNGFNKVVIGLSGGVDSALTAAVAVEALGAENVVGVMMPSPHSSKGSVDDSKQLARNLKIRIHTLPIKKAMRAYDGILKEAFAGTETGVAEENLQARIRGNLLMALSNKFGWLVLTTGNKSEVSVGYCTLYGDMAGGYAVIKDVPKTWVYPICRWLNANKEVIPENILTKPPSAELRPDQKDTDMLPDYALLDPLLEKYVEGDEGIESLKGLGLSAREIKRITRLVDTNEYKRRQAPPGVKITPKAFGRDRRLPITNRYKS
jgi:NAD+ synthase (glutamine-hydrolysing)